MKRVNPTVYEIGHILFRQDISGEYWMTNLSPLLRQLPIMYLCIPGTIHSATYSTQLPVHDRENDINISNQLVNGIRYLDLTVRWCSAKSAWMCGVHIPLADALRQISLFASTHFNEIVLVCMSFDVVGEHADVACMSVVLHTLYNRLFKRSSSSRTATAIWYSQYSIHQICASNRNIVLINNEFAYHPCVFPVSMKYIRSNDTRVVDANLEVCPVSMCTSFKPQPFMMRVEWYIPQSIPQRTFLRRCLRRWLCCRIGDVETETNDDITTIISRSHADLINYITSKRTFAGNLNKIFVLSVNHVEGIDVLDLCIQIMDRRFYV